MSEPRWLRTARSHIGLREVPGPRHNNTIVGWLAKLGAWWHDDEVPWCGTYCAAVMQQVGLPYPREYYRARAWSDYGARLRPDRLAPGAILVFERAGGGHVGFAVAQDATHYHVLGGNQSNAVNVMRIAKARLIASRWPRNEPVTGKLPWVKADGTAVSENEA